MEMSHDCSKKEMGEPYHLCGVVVLYGIDLHVMLMASEGGREREQWLDCLQIHIHMHIIQLK